MKLHRVLFIVLPLITSCSGSMKYSPDQLQSAKFGEKYNAQIELKGGSVIRDRFYYTIQPSSAGVYNTENYFPVLEEIRDAKMKGDGINVRCAGDFDNLNSVCNTIEIKGNINVKQDIVIELDGSTFGTSSPGIEFRKKFIIHVEE
ncbi:hypothetical protein EYW98_19275 [Escherichia coli]|uniref:hypothetical protein n=1 Tax=Escherichia sp. MOD1-EC7003 TaxID=2093900 RepID=UPI0012FFFDDD|nr:hypothetical protein [Escherichia sp. MOD1-EC7003]EGO8361511.1 hypothetical protein [Escherichia coli]EGO8378887.1 hypothetical protein [Escherichia coli]MCH0695076.1 hypothetical protein [Escherichia coli]